MSLGLKLLDIDHPLTFEESKLRQTEAHALIYLSATINLNFSHLPIIHQIWVVLLLA